MFQSILRRSTLADSRQPGWEHQDNAATESLGTLFWQEVLHFWHLPPSHRGGGGVQQMPACQAGACCTPPFWGGGGEGVPNVGNVPPKGCVQQTPACQAGVCCTWANKNMFMKSSWKLVVESLQLVLGTQNWVATSSSPICVPYLCRWGWGDLSHRLGKPAFVAHGRKNTYN